MKSDTNEPVRVTLTREKLAIPLLEKLNALAIRHVGIRLVIVFPQDEGWGQVSPGASQPNTEFCRLFHGNREGAEHCRMCHILMAIAARSDGAMVQRCHAGVSALVHPVGDDHHNSFTVLSSCVFVSEDREASWDVARRRAEKLGIDVAQLKAAHANLPRLTPEKMELARAILDIAGEAVSLVRDRMVAEATLEKLHKRPSPDREVMLAVEHELQRALAGLEVRSAARARDPKEASSALVDIVSDLVALKPNMPFSLNAIAAASRMTPNHFSYLFHRYRKQCFSDFLTERRLDMARALLKDLTLSVSEVAFKAGFRDAGYFARRFRQKNGLSPRAWRAQLDRPRRKG